MRLRLASDTDGWLHYGRDAGGERFSRLTQINTDNVGELELAWSYRHGDLQKFPERRDFAGYHLTPILLPPEAGGSLVGCTPFSRAFALDPANGRERWSHDPGIELSEVPTRLKCLGVAYFHDTQLTAGQNCEHKIIWGTHDRRIVAVDAKTGERCEGLR